MINLLLMVLCVVHTYDSSIIEESNYSGSKLVFFLIQSIISLIVASVLLISYKAFGATDLYPSLILWQVATLRDIVVLVIEKKNEAK